MKIYPPISRNQIMIDSSKSKISSQRYSWSLLKSSFIEMRDWKSSKGIPTSPIDPNKKKFCPSASTKTKLNNTNNKWKERKNNILQAMGYSLCARKHRREGSNWLFVFVFTVSRSLCWREQLKEFKKVTSIFWKGLEFCLIK